MAQLWRRAHLSCGQRGEQQPERFSRWSFRLASVMSRQFAAAIASDVKKWGEVIKRAGIKFE
jgi:tripartite-type tricarboxylate transporter receptor subunit TctC